MDDPAADFDAGNDELEADPEVAFYASLLSFLKEHGTPLSRLPQLGHKDLDFYKLYLSVTRLGGMDKVVENKQWREVSNVLRLPPSVTNAGFALRQLYTKFLLGYERRYFHGDQDVSAQPSASAAPSSPAIGDDVPVDDDDDSATAGAQQSSSEEGLSAAAAGEATMAEASAGSAGDAMAAHATDATGSSPVAAAGPASAAQHGADAGAAAEASASTTEAAPSAAAEADAARGQAQSEASANGGQVRTQDAGPDAQAPEPMDVSGTTPDVQTDGSEAGAVDASDGQPAEPLEYDEPPQLMFRRVPPAAPLGPWFTGGPLELQVASRGIQYLRYPACPPQSSRVVARIAAAERERTAERLPRLSDDVQQQILQQAAIEDAVLPPTKQVETVEDNYLTYWSQLR